MDNSERRHQAISRLHAGLPRQGPGSEQNTRHALSLLPQISSNAIVYDLGCGPGRASLVLAEVLKLKIVAVDLDKSFLAQLERDAVACEMDQLIETRCADMAVLNEAPASVGLIWSEGAIYCVGFDIALRAWRPFLVDDGVVACSELSWLVAHPSAEPSVFWHENYPGMRSVEENVAAAERQGYHCFAHYTLPTNCWWDEYYTPWLRNIEMLRKDVEHDEILREVWTNAVREIDLYRRFDHEYGYEFYLLRKSALHRADF